MISGSIPTDCMGLFWEITQLSLWDYCMLRDCMLCFQNFGLHDLSNKPSDIATCNYSHNSSSLHLLVIYLLYLTDCLVVMTDTKQLEAIADRLVKTRPSCST